MSPNMSPDTTSANGPGRRYYVKCCGVIIQSQHVHDMVWCKCGKNAIDGGNVYVRIAGDRDDFEAIDE